MRTPTKSLGNRLFNYLSSCGEVLDNIDAMFILGSKYPEVADTVRFANEIYDFEYIVFTGNEGRNTRGRYRRTEAEVLYDRAKRWIKPGQHTYIEKLARNTGENLTFSMKMLGEDEIYPQRILLAQNPTMATRAAATFKNLFPNLNFCCIVPEKKFDEYLSESDSGRQFVCELVGNVERVLEYPKLGFQVEVDVPKDVREAYEELIRRGLVDDMIIRK